MKKYSLVVGLFMMGLGLNAQSQFKSEIPDVNEPGYYEVLLNPEITGSSKADLGDLRLVNEKGEEVPFIIDEKPLVERSREVEELEIVSVEQKQFSVRKWGWFTEVVIKNPNHRTLDQISLRMKNAQLKKRLKLSGSEDGETWFGVQDECDFTVSASTKETSRLKVLGFPTVNYLYLKLMIRNYQSDPLNIQSAFIETDSYKRNPLWTCVVDTFWVEHYKKDPHTLVHVKMNQPYFLYELGLSVSGADYYDRQYAVQILEDVKIKKKVVERVSVINRGRLRSDRVNSLSLFNEPLSEFQIRIENGDNPFLDIADVKLYAKEKSIIAKLDTSTSYHLEFGDPKKRKPRYDLENFKHSVQTIGTIQAGGVVSNQGKEKVAEEVWFKQLILWGIIGGVLIVLGFYSVRMVREMGLAERER